jgi:23S rRNA pseudouridine955/2504/2580 synthase/23S rRNA pseudouridine1911/1915/1917 synthase
VRTGEKLNFSAAIQSRKDKWWQERILYQDDDLVVLNKPSGITSNEEETLEALQGEWPDCVPVHRLDRDTTGVWLLARGSKAREHLESLFRKRSVKKHYFAVVDGIPKTPKGTVTDPILRIKGEQDNHRWKIDPKGRAAETSWTLDRKGKKMALLSCYPKTGRTHQIRLHCKAIGHPVVGDYRYTRTFTCELHPERQLLHARSVSITHPSTEEKMTFTAPIPDDLKKVINQMSNK